MGHGEVHDLLLELSGVDVEHRLGAWGMVLCTMVRDLLLAVCWLGHGEVYDLLLAFCGVDVGWLCWACVRQILDIDILYICKHTKFKINGGYAR